MRLAASAAFLGALGVLLGAFGTHLLRPLLPLQAVTIFLTGVYYQLWHVLAILLCVLLAEVFPLRAKEVRLAGWGFVCGTLLFSGGLYATAMGWWLVNWVVPLGGGVLVLSWLLLAWGLLAGGRGTG